MNAQVRKDDVMRALTEMVTEVLGEDDLEIEPETQFRDGLGFESIQLIALADMIQMKYADVNFATWLQSKELAAILALRVGDVADFVVASTAE